MSLALATKQLGYLHPRENLDSFPPSPEDLPPPQQDNIDPPPSVDPPTASHLPPRTNPFLDNDDDSTDEDIKTDRILESVNKRQQKLREEDNILHNTIMQTGASASEEDSKRQSGEARSGNQNNDLYVNPYTVYAPAAYMSLYTHIPNQLDQKQQKQNIHDDNDDSRVVDTNSEMKAGSAYKIVDLSAGSRVRAEEAPNISAYKTVDLIPKPNVKSSAAPLRKVAARNNSKNSDIASVHTLSIDFTSELHRLLALPNGSERRQQLLQLFDNFHTTALEGIYKVKTGDVKPANLGGEAGGEKYIWKDILIKKAEDRLIVGQFLYGGQQPSPEWAGKAASNELKASNALFRYFFNNRIPVVLPLQMLVDYCGERYVAMSVLPLNEAKLVYGSNNSGRTVMNNDQQLDQWLSNMAEHFHLARHMVNGTALHLAGDVEGHRTSDGHYYLLDLARMWPPEDQRKPPPSSVFFRLLRPEYLFYLRDNQLSPPLSPDALSLWGGSEGESGTHNINVQQATEHLLTVRVQACGAELDRNIANDTLDVSKLLEQFRDDKELKLLLKGWLEPYKTRIRSPVRWIPLLNFLLQRWASMNHVPVPRAWNARGHALHADWHRVYGEYFNKIRLSDVFHSYGIPVRHLSYVHSHAQTSQAKRWIERDAVGRVVKSRLRWMLREEPGQCPAFLKSIETGTLSEDGHLILEMLLYENFSLPGDVLQQVLSDKRNAVDVVQYAKSTSKIEGEVLVARPKPNSFITLIRAMDHYANACTEAQKSIENDTKNTSLAYGQIIMERLREVVATASELVLSDPKNEEARVLRDGCQVLVDLYPLRGTLLSKADSMAEINAATLQAWFAAIAHNIPLIEDHAEVEIGAQKKPNYALALGSAVIGNKRLCLAFMGSSLETHGHLLPQFAYWPSREAGLVELVVAASHRSEGMLNALIATGLAPTALPGLILGAIVVDVDKLTRKKKPTKETETERDEFLGVITQRDGYFKKKKKVVVIWNTEKETIVDHKLRSSLKSIDLEFLRACAQQGQDFVYEAVKQRLPGFRQVWNTITHNKGNDNATEATVQSSFVGAWDWMIQDKDLVAMDILFPHRKLYGPDILLNSCRGGYMHAVDRLIAHGYSALDVNASQETCFMYAAGSGNIELCRRLIQLGVKLDAKNIRKETAMHYAAKCGNEEIITFLVKSGLDVSELSESGSPMFQACREGNEGTIQAIFELRDSEADSRGSAPMVQDAAEAGYRSLFDLVQRISMTYAEYRGMLLTVVNYGNLAVLEPFLSRGVVPDMYAPDDFMNPCMIALRENRDSRDSKFNSVLVTRLSTESVLGEFFCITNANKCVLGELDTYEFKINGMSFQISDLGPPPYSNNPKGFNLYCSQLALVVISLLNYNRRNEAGENLLDVDLEMFESLSWWDEDHTQTCLLVLVDRERFYEELQRVPLTTWNSDYLPSSEEQPEIAFILDQFEAIWEKGAGSRPRDIRTYNCPKTQVEWDTFHNRFQTISKDIVIKKGLTRAGLI